MGLEDPLGVWGRRSLCCTDREGNIFEGTWEVGAMDSGTH
jgi:hypothetical protein